MTSSAAKLKEEDQKQSLANRRNSKEVVVSVDKAHPPKNQSKKSKTLGKASKATNGRKAKGNGDAKTRRAHDPFSSEKDAQDALSAATTPVVQKPPQLVRLHWKKSDEIFRISEGMKVKQLDGRVVLPVLEDRLYFQAAGFEPKHKAGGIVFYFTLEDDMEYESFCADFGPFNLGMTHRFGEILKGLLLNPKLQKSKLILYSDTALEDVTNAIYLLGSFLCVHLGATPEEAWVPFAQVEKCPCRPYRDCTWVEPNPYDLHVKDCWAGLIRAVQKGLYNPADFNKEEYFYYDDPKHGDMHEVVKGKFFAFKGPSQERVQIRPGLFTFLPTDYCHVFKYKGVRTVIRLNEKKYDRQMLVKNGFHHIDMPFDDCTPPPDTVVDRFLRIAETSEGGIAVHCTAGLGRTGTLIALYMMKHLAFSANEAMAWLRICRPGSVIGPQQKYLARQETRMRELKKAKTVGLGLSFTELKAEAAKAEEAAAAEEAATGMSAGELAEMVERGMAERDAARVGGQRRQEGTEEEEGCAEGKKEKEKAGGGEGTVDSLVAQLREADEEETVCCEEAARRMAVMDVNDDDEGEPFAGDLTIGRSMSVPEQPSRRTTAASPSRRATAVAPPAPEDSEPLPGDDRKVAARASVAHGRRAGGRAGVEKAATVTESEVDFGRRKGRVRKAASMPDIPSRALEEAGGKAEGSVAGSVTGKGRGRRTSTMSTLPGVPAGRDKDLMRDEEAAKGKGRLGLGTAASRRSEAGRAREMAAGGAAGEEEEQGGDAQSAPGAGEAPAAVRKEASFLSTVSGVSKTSTMRSRNAKARVPSHFVKKDWLLPGEEHAPGFGGEDAAPAERTLKQEESFVSQASSTLSRSSRWANVKARVPSHFVKPLHPTDEHAEDAPGVAAELTGSPPSER